MPVLDISREFEAIAESYAASGGAAASLLDDGVASLVVSHNRVLRVNSIPGVRIEGKETPTGARATITGRMVGWKCFPSPGRWWKTGGCSGAISN